MLRKTSLTGTAFLPCCNVVRSLVSRPSVGHLRSYDPKAVESGWYNWWYENNVFSGGDQTQRFTLCLPPPNVTGNLHVGHALTVAIEDALCRWHRMRGHRVTWIPGFDHAGIATQLVVEREILRTKGLLRKSMSPEMFLAECNVWKDRKVESIASQLKNLGASLDWSRLYYTLDKTFSSAVIEAFRQLFDKGLIYRDKKMVNWSPYLQCCLSDIEIEHMECSERTDYRVPGVKQPVTLGCFYYVKYPLADSATEFITVATSRPETIPADQAIAVHPNDDRYSRLIGKRVLHPLFGGKTLPVVADTAVERDVGTGAVKITPAHSTVDSEIGVRHSLPLDVSCIDEAGNLNEVYPECQGMNRFAARDSIVKTLASKGLLADCKAHRTVTPVCSRSGDIVESVLKEQWFLDCKHLSAKAAEVLDKLEILPTKFGNEWKNWFSLSRDWCLSRSIWWGHSIPAYSVRMANGNSRWVVAGSQNDAYARLNESGIVMSEVVSVIKEKDVLDTWFSSALIPLVVAGWPTNFRQGADQLFPLSMMETGHDILGFWVAKMVMLSLPLSGQLPFRRIVLHGLLRDRRGQKMSKSRGNVIEVSELIDGKDGSSEMVMGADALRFTLLRQDMQNDWVELDPALLLKHKRFCNKLWQSFYYMKQVWSDECPRPLQVSDLSVVDSWILSCLSTVVREMNDGMDKLQLHRGVNAAITFWWNQFCDVYLEYTKYQRDGCRAEVVRSVLCFVADTFLRCLAPHMPFLCEELYSAIPRQEKCLSIHLDKYPSTKNMVQFSNPNLEMEMNFVLGVAHQIHSLRHDLRVQFQKKLDGVANCNDVHASTLTNLSEFVSRYCNIDFKVVRGHADEHPADFDNDSVCVFASDGCQFFVRIEHAERQAAGQRFSRELDKLSKTLTQNSKRIERLRSSSDVSELQQKIDRLTADNAEIEERIRNLKKIKNSFENHPKMQIKL